MTKHQHTKGILNGKYFNAVAFKMKASIFKEKKRDRECYGDHHNINLCSDKTLTVGMESFVPREFTLRWITSSTVFTRKLLIS